MLLMVSAAVLAMPSTLKDIPYVPDGGPRRTLDLYLPNGSGKHPLVIYIHGGGFMSGSKEGASRIQWPAREGWAMAALNYRLSGEAKFPAGIEDCKAAIRWLRKNAGKYSLDPDRLVVWGASSGGNFAAMIGTTSGKSKFDVGENLDTSSAVQGVINYFGPTDFLQMDAQRIPGGTLHSTPTSPESRYLGADIRTVPDLVKAANPITYVTPSSPPFFIAHGTQDAVVAIGQSDILADALKAAKVPVVYLKLKGAGHGFRGQSPRQAQELQNAVGDFLRTIAKGKKPESSTVELEP